MYSGTSYTWEDEEKETMTVYVTVTTVYLYGWQEHMLKLLRVQKTRNEAA